MPLLTASSYRPPPGLAGGHAQTLFAYFLRRVEGPAFERERLSTPDDDFIDLDWARIGGNALVVMLHGLEGNARRPYMRGMAHAFNRRGWDAVGMNFRGCSGEPNRAVHSYHGGSSGDLAHALDYIVATGRYDRLALIGFSLGGNVVLKYLGEYGAAVPGPLTHAVAFSVPTNFSAGSRYLDRLPNRLYRKNFLRALTEKVQDKYARFPEDLPALPRTTPRTIYAFDDWYTAPVHGFRDATHYYETVSSGRHLPSIRIPALLVNARNDPFLPEACYPVATAEDSRWLTLEMPASGGHLGFVTFDSSGEYWSETRACAFVGIE